MRFMIAILVVLATAAVSAAQDYQYRYSTPRIGGGYRYYGSGGSFSYSTPRIGGGYRYYGSDGRFGYSTPRIGGGYRYHGFNGFDGYSPRRNRASWGFGD